MPLLVESCSRASLVCVHKTHALFQEDVDGNDPAWIEERSSFV